MKFRVPVLSLALTILFRCGVARGQAENTGIRAGPSMAVTEANARNGFRLSKKAKQVIGVVLKRIEAASHRVPSSALIYYGPRIGVYRLRSGWFKLIELQTSGPMAFSPKNPPDLMDDDEIVVVGGALLRVAEMDAFGGEQ